MIELAEATKIIAGRPIVDRVCLQVAEGQLCALVGSSGAGKTTTLKLVNRLVPLSSGTIRVAGEDVMAIRPEALRRRIGYVIQSGGLFPHRTVEENIATVPRLLGWERRRIEARIDVLMAMLQLERARFGGKYPHELSGGQQQRVGLARALAAEPKLLLMDEPFGALDPVIRAELAAEVARIHRAIGTTILMVTHDFDLALRHADKVAVMHEGRIEQAGTPCDILTRPSGAFVHDLVAHSLPGLKILALRRVAERAQPGAAGAAGEPIAADATLADALSEMVVRGTERLPVRGEDGAVTQSISLDDVVR
ncbi:MAG: ABC transporter ATP-binding protein [Stellaceae bacterium]